MSVPLTILSSMATRTLLSRLAAEHEARTGQAVALRSLGGVEAARRVRAGEKADVIVLAAGAMEALAREGHVRLGSAKPFVRSHVALAVPVGAPLPDIASEAALREAILCAPTIHYSTGPSGDQFMRLLTDWDIAERVGARLAQAPPGVPVGTRIAEEGGIGLQQLSELTGIPGIAVVGVLPPDLEMSTVFTAGIGRDAHAIDAADRLVAFLASSEAAAEKRQFAFDAI